MTGIVIPSGCEESFPGPFIFCGERNFMNHFRVSSRWREILPPLGLLVQRRFDLEPAVEIVPGRIHGNVPADFAVEVEPQEILVFRRNTDHAVGDT